MIKIFYGKNSLHCQVAAALLLSSLSGKTVSDYIPRYRQNYNRLIYIGSTRHNKIYYFAADKDQHIIPTIIKSLEEMFGLEECELIKVSGPGFYLDVLLRISKNLSNYKLSEQLYHFSLKKIIDSLQLQPWKQLT